MRQVSLKKDGDCWVVQMRAGKVLTLPERIEYSDDRPTVWVEPSEHTQDIRLIRASREAVESVSADAVFLKMRPY